MGFSANIKIGMKSLMVLTLLVCSQKGISQYLGGNYSGSTMSLGSSQVLGATDSLYNGGDGDGSDVDRAQNRHLGIADSVYNGSDGDGHALASSINIQLGVADSVNNGGNGDGFSFDRAANRPLGVADSVYNGGNGDGFSLDTALSKQLGIADSIYNGGLGDGAAQGIAINRTLAIVDSIYNGGTGRGDIIFLAPSVNLNTCSGATVVWNGSVNNNWNNAGNWDCGMLPGINSNVVIPTGRPRYPNLFINVEIRSLLLQSGTSVDVRPGATLKLNGQ